MTEPGDNVDSSDKFDADHLVKAAWRKTGASEPVLTDDQWRKLSRDDDA